MSAIHNVTAGPRVLIRLRTFGGARCACQQRAEDREGHTIFGLPLRADAMDMAAVLSKGGEVGGEEGWEVVDCR